MVRFRSWQRGAADLVSVAVGLTLLAIVFAGTAGSFVYGREALAREEHFKQVAYMLRARMEEVQAAIEMVSGARTPGDPRCLLGGQVYPVEEIESNMRYDNPTRKPIRVTIQRMPIDTVNLVDTGPALDYYVLTMKATWREHDLPEDRRTEPGKDESLTFTTAFVVRGIL
jgi:hypothetical protein